MIIQEVRPEKRPHPSGIRVLLVTHEDPDRLQGGLGTFIREYSHSLSQVADVRVLFLDYQPGPLWESFMAYYRIPVYYTFPAESYEGKVLSTSQWIQRAVQPILQDWSPHIIHCNDRQTFLPFLGLHNVVFSLHLSIPDLLRAMELDEGGLSEYQKLENRVERCALDESHRVILYSRFMERRFPVSADMQERYHLCRLGVNQEEVQVSVASAAKPGDRWVFTYYGRLDDQQKGIKIFIDGVNCLPQEALDTWKNQGRPLEFRLMGFGRPQRDWNLERFSQVSFVHGRDRVRALEESHVVVMPSRYEPFGLAGLEALGQGALLLATPGLGMDEYWQPGRNGLALETEPQALAAQMLKVLDQWDSLDSLRQEGVAEARRWTWERSVQDHWNVYREVCPTIPAWDDVLREGPGKDPDSGGDSSRAFC